MSAAYKILVRTGAKRLCTVSLAVVLAAGTLLAGCSGTNNTTNADNTANESAPATTVADDESTDSETTEDEVVEGVKDIDLSALDLDYTDRDKDPSYDESSAVKIALNGSTATVQGTSSGVSVNGGVVTISQEGVYVFSGTLTQGQIVVECNKEDKAKVQIVLNGVTITNSTGPAVYVKQAKKAFVTLAAGSTNTLSDGADYTLEDGSDEPYACIFSKDNLTLQGSGTLNVNGTYRHAICSKDDLVITGGTYNVTAVEDALRGRDCVKICGGTFNLTSGEDAIKSNRDNSNTKGYVVIDGGTFTINAGDDAVHAETALIINDGTISVESSYEGFEGQQIYINGGKSYVVASDDGLNAAVGSSVDAMNGMGDAGQNHKWDFSGSDGAPAGDAPDGQVMPGGMGGTTQAGYTTVVTTVQAADSTTVVQAAGGPGGDMGGMGGKGGGMSQLSAEDAEKVFLQINGGYLEVDAGGDGLDSNGHIEMTGGTVYVNGPNSSGDGALDYETTASVSGGTLIAVGSVGMAEGFTDGTQPFATINASGGNGSTIELCDASGTVVASMTASKTFGNVVVTAPGLGEGSTCTLKVDGSATDFTPSTEATSNFGTQGFGGQGFNGMQPRR
ncbi:MAG: carbohydrate-binding domain-containing protein [Coriobacteriia bacterium]|nr:carbohydrate-binding domain-containing protein [Coriobacteriia bacterium]